MKYLLMCLCGLASLLAVVEANADNLNAALRRENHSNGSGPILTKNDTTGGDTVPNKIFEITEKPATEQRPAAESANLERLEKRYLVMHSAGLVLAVGVSPFLIAGAMWFGVKYFGLKDHLESADPDDSGNIGSGLGLMVYGTTFALFTAFSAVALLGGTALAITGKWFYKRQVERNEKANASRRPRYGLAVLPVLTGSNASGAIASLEARF